MDPAHLRQVFQPDPLNPDNPVVFTLETFGRNFAPVLSSDQPGLTTGPTDQMFIQLETLAELGRIAQSLLDQGE